MSKMYKEFLLNKIAKLDNGNKFDKNKMTHNNPCYNFVSRTSTNNGISDFVDDNGTEPYPAGTITLAFGGSIGSTFVQPKPFYTGQNVGVITLPDGVSEEAKLFFAASLEKMCKNKYVAFADEINKHYKTDLTVILPVVENANPNHEYTPADIDWDYMRDRIKELERDRIKELERDRIKELDAYLKATELNDYELTEKDKQVLAEGSTCGGNGTVGTSEIQLKQFKIKDLFDWSNGNIDLKKKDINGLGLPVVSSGVQNCGIIGLTDRAARIQPANTITIDMFGYAFFRGFEYKEVTHARVFTLIPKGFKLNDKTGNYIVAQLRWLSSAFNYNNMCTYDKLKDYTIVLPVTSSGTPDWDFMERYIRATEKQVIAGVVQYKDRVIEETRRLVS